MDKSILIELNRINTLMGQKQLVLESGGKFLQALEAIFKTSTNAFKNLDNALKAMKKNIAEEVAAGTRTSSKLTDADIDRIVSKLEDDLGNLSIEERRQLRKLLKEESKIRNVLDDTSTTGLYDDLKKLDSEYNNKVPEGLSLLGKFTKLSQKSIDDIVRDRIRVRMSSGTNALATFKTSLETILDGFFKKMDTEFPKWQISSIDDYWNVVDQQIHNFIKKQVDEGVIPQSSYDEYVNAIKDEIHCCSSLRNKLDDMIDDGRVLNKKNTTKPKMSVTEPTITIPISKMVDWKKPPPDPYKPFTKMPDGTSAAEASQKPKSDFFEDDTLEFGTGGQYLNWFQRTYWSVIEPWSRVWRTQFELGLEDLAGKTLQQYEKEFLEAANDAFTRYKAEGMTKQTISQVRKMVQKFQKVPRVSEFYISSSGNPIYAKAWDDFVKYGRKDLQNKPDELEKFNEFVRTLEQKNLGHRNSCFSDLIEGTKKVDSANKSFDDLSGGEQMQKEFNDLAASASGKRILENIKKGLWALVFKIYTHAWTGFFTTPREFSLALTKESNKSVMLAAQGNKVVSKVMRTRAATGKYIEKLFMAKILLPAFIGTFEMIFEGFTTAGTGLKIKERGDDYDSGLMNWFANYAVYDILNGIQVGTYIKDMFEKMRKIQGNVEEWEIWWNRTEATIPGIGDSLLLFIPYLLAEYGSFAGKGQTPTEFKEELDSILEPREISERGPGGTSDSVANLKAEFRLNVSRRDPKVSLGTIQKVIDRLRWNYITVDGKPISSEPTLFWVEDLIEDKQYSIEQNPKWNVLPDEQQYLWKNAPNNKENTLNHLAKAFENNYIRKVEEFCQKQKTEETLATSKKLCDSIKTQNPLGDVQESKKYINKNLIMENTPRTKFGEDNFKHWKDTFVFKAEDEKNPGQFKQVKINMEDVMDRINHYRKKYDEDDAFVRAVLDTHDNVVKVMYTKDLADISESALPRGLALVLREDRGELEIFSVSRPANGNWFLVKGDYTPSQMANMDLEKKEPEDKETTKTSKTEDDLKKKEEESIILLKRNEKEGLIDLPRKVKQKLKEKISKGWTTEEPPSYLMDFYTTSQINSVFNDPIEIYKLESSPSYFATLVKYSARVTPKRGFCRSLHMASRGEELNERQRKTINHILTRCKSKLAGKFGIASF